MQKGDNTMNGKDVEIRDFTGETNYKLDGKGRITIPMKDEECVYLLIGVDQKEENRCLYCMTTDEFRAYYRRLAAIPTDSSAFVLVKHILSSVKKVAVDATGKILIPKQLKEYADIHELVVFCIGRYSYELWSYERLEAKRKKDLARADAYKALEVYLTEGVDPSDPDTMEKAKRRIDTENAMRESMNKRDELNSKGGTDDE